MRVSNPLPASADGQLVTRRRILPWRDPLAVAGACADEAFSLAMSCGRWTYLTTGPARVEELWPQDGRDGWALMRGLLGRQQPATDGPPFQGGIVGLASYEMADRSETLGLARDPDWPDLILADYRAILAFDHSRREVSAIAQGRDDAEAVARLDAMVELFERPSTRAGLTGDVLAETFAGERDEQAYETAVADVVRRIRAGELFQANIARSWRGQLRPGVSPFDVYARLAKVSLAPFAAYWRLPGRAIVSNSPERFLKVDGLRRRVESEPIKGTRPRGATPAEDQQLRAELIDSPKDRAENLMIVDLMRNDLARACAPGSVEVERLCEARAFANVHHLVSTVAGRLRPDADGAELMRVAFPPGSITGAPKVQAMKLIAGHEAPRGPWCGSLFWAGADGSLDSSVLIRTAAFVCDGGAWRFRASAGAGIVADSDPVAERLETEAKISALRRALTEAI